MNILKTAFNFLNNTRHSVLPAAFDKLRFDGKYLSQTAIGLGNGYLHGLTGKVRYDGEVRPLIISPGTKFHFENGSAIILSDGDKEIPLEHSYNHFMPNASALGFVPYWKFLNPPAGRPTSLRMQRASQLIFYPNTLIYRGAYISIWPEKSLTIGKNTAIGASAYINTRCGLFIGSNVMLGHSVTIMDYDGHPIFYEGKLPEEDTYGGDAKPIHINDNVWIGFGSSILKGVTIGEGAMVGANSCVTRDVPPNTMVAGNPAKLIRENVSWKKY